MTAVIPNPSPVASQFAATVVPTETSLPVAPLVEPTVEISFEAVKFITLDLLRDAGVVNSVVIDLLGFSTLPVELDVTGEFADPDTLAILEALSTPEERVEGSDEAVLEAPALEVSNILAIGLQDMTGDVVITAVVDSLTGEIPAVGVDYDLVVDVLASVAGEAIASVYQIPAELLPIDPFAADALATDPLTEGSALPEIPIFIVGLPEAAMGPEIDVPLDTLPQFDGGVFPSSAELMAFSFTV